MKKIFRILEHMLWFLIESVGLLVVLLLGGLIKEIAYIYILITLSTIGYCMLIHKIIRKIKDTKSQDHS